MFRVMTCLTSDHDWRLVVLAGLVCFLASCAAVTLMHRAVATRGRARIAWITTAGAATGCGIWATHFIAILAYDPGVVIGYGVVLTVISLVVAIAITSCGLAMAVNGKSKWSAPLGGGIVGGGIACMHFLGMSALELPGHITWSDDLVVASVLVGIVFGVGAIAAARMTTNPLWSLGSAVLLTLSIVAHHFTAMGAVTIVADPTRPIDGLIMSPSALAVTIAAATIAMLGMSMVASFSDRRTRSLVGDRNRLLDAALNNMVQGVNMFDAHARLVLLNERYLQMYRLSADAVKPGSTIREIVEARVHSGTFFTVDSERYITELTEALLHDRTPSQKTLELDDGRVIAVSSQPMAAGGWVVTHEDITERSRAIAELERTRNFFDTILENVPAPIIVKDARDLRYMLMNRAGEEFYGIPRDRMIGQRSTDVFTPRHAEQVESRDRQLLTDGVRQVYDARPVETPGNGRRLVTSTRLLIKDEQQAPQYLVTLLQDVTERKRAEARIAHLAHYDGLTDLPNRAAFNECLASTLEHAAAENEKFALLSIDLDRFKEVNDVFGHAIGDQLLRAFGERLGRASEAAFMARLGGDEFAVIVSGGDQPAGASALAERVMAMVADDFEINGERIRIGLSIGVAIYPADGAEASELIANADAALYRAKTGGRGLISFFAAETDQRLRERRLLVHDLSNAIGRGELTIYYQPQARIDGEITGFEALIRWKHPTRGLIPPDMFIPAAEESGLIVQIGEWVLREACREAAGWAKPLNIGINLSAVQFRHGDLPGLVHTVLLETGLAPGRVELEITESVLIDDFARGVSILRRLKLLGVHIAMDDFGTGYSSLQNLQAFPFDRIKIDRSFIASLQSNRQSATIVRAVIGLGRGLGLPVIAEGVETREQLAFLSSESCAEVQGYLVGKPLPIEAYSDAVGREPAPAEQVA
ncbi:MAG TPA: EAL domain-containing protein [Xanthobacteraceae bacterium]|jgi:diguanylate cyclase (GGDEF)-like protein/PAS domain S-box-containing protein